MWHVVGGIEVKPPENVIAFKKCNIKADKIMFAIRTTVDEEMLEYISMETQLMKKCWSTLVLWRRQMKHMTHAPHFSKKRMVQDCLF